MNRTQRLMASVAAVVAMLGSKVTTLTAGTTDGRNGQAPAAGQKSQKSYTASEAADAVFPKVDVFRSKALTVEEVQKRLPDLDAKTIAAGLERLIYDGKIKRIGEGTEQSPYKYYRYEGGTGG